MQQSADFDPSKVLGHFPRNTLDPVVRAEFLELAYLKSGKQQSLEMKFAQSVVEALKKAREDENVASMNYFIELSRIHALDSREFKSEQDKNKSSFTLTSMIAAGLSRIIRFPIFKKSMSRKRISFLQHSEGFWIGYFNDVHRRYDFLNIYLKHNRNTLLPREKYVLNKTLMFIDPTIAEVRQGLERSLTGTIEEKFRLRDFISMEFYLFQLPKLNPLLHEYYRYLILKTTGNPVTSGEWEELSLKVDSENTALKKKISIQILHALIQEENLNKALDYFMQVDHEFDIAKQSPKNFIGLIKLMLKKEDIAGVKSFRERLRDQFRNYGMEKYLDIYLHEVDRDISRRENKSNETTDSKIFQKINELSTLPENRAILDRMNLIYSDLEKKHPCFFDIRFDEGQRKDVFGLIQAHVLEKKPFLLIRLGDGESLGLDTSEFPQKQLKEDHDGLQRILWYKPLDQAVLETIKKQFQDTLANADVIGIPSIYRFIADFLDPNKPLLGSRTQRGNWVVLTSLAQLLREGKFLSVVRLVEHRCHHVMFSLENIMKLISVAQNAVVVSRYVRSDFEAVLGDKNIEYITVPAQMEKNRPLPLHMESIVSEIRTKLKPGALVLIAAGYSGKYFLKISKDAGCIALDVGAMADYWVGNKSRQVSDLV